MNKYRLSVYQEIEICLMVIASITEDREYFLTWKDRRPDDMARQLHRMDQRFEEWHARLMKLTKGS